MNDPDPDPCFVRNDAPRLRASFFDPNDPRLGRDMSTKMQAFSEELEIGDRLVDAVRRAGYLAQSDASAHTTGRRLLRDPRVALVLVQRGVMTETGDLVQPAGAPDEVEMVGNDPVREREAIVEALEVCARIVDAEGSKPNERREAAKDRIELRARLERLDASAAGADDDAPYGQNQILWIDSEARNERPVALVLDDLARLPTPAMRYVLAVAAVRFRDRLEGRVYDAPWMPSATDADDAPSPLSRFEDAVSAIADDEVRRYVARCVVADAEQPPDIRIRASNLVWGERDA